jgi:putative transposase
MKELNLEPEQKKRFKPMCTQSNHDYGYHPNLLKQLGSPQRCNQVWTTDTTFLKTEEGWCYLATVMDLHSRRIVGWSVSINNDTELTCQALEAAVMTRGGKIPPSLIHHSDRGSTYASDKYASLLRKYKMRPSMSAKGNCYDNAAMESFYGRYKTCSHLPVFSRVEYARTHAFEYIEVFYNRFRKHSSLGYKNPVQFEEISDQLQAEAALPACIQNN